MRTFRTAGIAPAIVAMLVIGADATAGSVVTMESVDYTTNPPRPSTVTVSVDGAMLRLDAAGQSPDDAGSLLFDGERSEMTAIDHSRRQYFVMDEATLNAISDQLNDARRQMQAALADMPPEQRAMAEQMMNQRMGAVQQQIKPRSIEATGESDTVNGYDCDMYAVTESGRKTRDMCVTAWSSIDGGEDFADSMKRMAAFFEDMRQMFSRSGMDLMGSRSDVFSHMREINGLPVRSRDYDLAGGLSTETTLVSAESASFDDAGSFAVPADYTEQKIPQTRP